MEKEGKIHILPCETTGPSNNRFVGYGSAKFTLVCVCDADGWTDRQTDRQTLTHTHTLA